MLGEIAQMALPDSLGDIAKDTAGNELTEIPEVC
jgi:hypothetical protein